MSYNIGDRVRLTDAHDFDLMRNDPFTMLMAQLNGDSRTELPSVGDIGTVERLVEPGSQSAVLQGAPDNGLYVRFDGLDGTWGIVPDEVELAEEIAA